MEQAEQELQILPDLLAGREEYFGGLHLFLQPDVAKSHDVTCLEDETPSACESNIFILLLLPIPPPSHPSISLHIILFYFFFGRNKKHLKTKFGRRNFFPKTLCKIFNAILQKCSRGKLNSSLLVFCAVFFIILFNQPLYIFKNQRLLRHPHTLSFCETKASDPF